MEPIPKEKVLFDISNLLKGSMHQWCHYRIFNYTVVKGNFCSLLQVTRTGAANKGKLTFKIDPRDNDEDDEDDGFEGTRWRRRLPKERSMSIPGGFQRQVHIHSSIEIRRRRRFLRLTALVFLDGPKLEVVEGGYKYCTTTL